MKYPEKLQIGDTIGVTAISCGAEDETDVLRFENAIKNVEALGYKIKTTPNCRTLFRGRSSSAEQRAREFMELYEDPKVKAIIFFSGGDFACELLEKLDFEKISKLPVKWIQGYSDCTNLTLTFNTILDIASIYGPTFKSYGMRNIHSSLLNALRLMQKEEFVQESYEKCEAKEEDDQANADPYYEYSLTQEDRWINLKNEEKIQFQGRCLGGCIDLLREVIIGSKFDRLQEFCEKYQKDGIIWILEEFEGNTPENYRTLWRMRNMGLFNYCKGILFGRPLMMREDYGISYQESIREAIGDLNIPMIVDADIGHLAPQIPIIMGSIIEVTSQNGKGTIKNILQ